MTSILKYEEEATGLSLIGTRELTVLSSARIYEKNEQISPLCAGK